MKSKIRSLLHKMNRFWDRNSKQHEILRERYDKLLNDLSRSEYYDFEGNVLIDAGWDNPNYWLRYSMVRVALGLAAGHEAGLLGPFRRSQQKSTLRHLGITTTFDFTKTTPASKLNCELAHKLCKSIDKREDILKWSLPYELPPEFLYDYILKKQRQEFVKIDDPHLCEYVQYFLNCISAADKIISQFNPDLVISSHAVSWYFSFVWIALKRGIKVIVLAGDAGILRFWQINHPSEIYDFEDRPTYEDFLKASDFKRDAMQKIGKEYLCARLRGKTENLGAIYAYSKRNKHVDRSLMCSEFDWEQDKKIIGVYASNWFDFPHGLGMSAFRDFYDWIISTLEVAKKNRNVNWLFKAHPCDDWYGGFTLEDVIGTDDLNHIKLAPKDWEGASMIDAIDAIITFHGTIGIEATAIGKPVIVADKGWYHDWGIVKVPKSREEYLQLLGTSWWVGMDLKKNARLAQIFAGWYWGRPAWQKDFLLDDDSLQWDIYKTAPDLLKNNSDAIKKEVAMVRKWFYSGSQHYHTYKMMQTDEYIV